METKFVLDITQFGAGALLGFVVALVLRLRSLKSLDLKLNKIGLDLGVEGFDHPSADGAIQNSVNGNISGDFVGRDKNTTNQSFYDKVQRAVASSNRRAEQAITRSNFAVYTKDSEFSRALQELQGSDIDWFYKYVDACLRRAEFLEPIHGKLTELQAAGWETRELTFDNHCSNGMYGLQVALHVTRSVRGAA